jgi:hypothetical protein
MAENQRNNQQESFWQIMFPLILGGLIILGLGAWIIWTAAGEGSVRQAADVSTVLLVIPVLVFALIPLALFGAGAYGIYRLRGVLPPYFQKVLQFIESIRAAVGKAADKSVEPIYSLGGILAAVRYLLKKPGRPISSDE